MRLVVFFGVFILLETADQAEVEAQCKTFLSELETMSSTNRRKRLDQIQV